jgi:hypothetical protein
MARCSWPALERPHVSSRATFIDRGHSGSEEVAEDDAGFDVRQLCVRKREAEGRDEPLMEADQVVRQKSAYLNLFLIWPRRHQPGMQYVT